MIGWRCRDAITTTIITTNLSHVTVINCYCNNMTFVDGIIAVMTVDALLHGFIRSVFLTIILRKHRGWEFENCRKYLSEKAL